MPADRRSTTRYYEELDCWVVWGDVAREALDNRHLSSQTFEVANLSYLSAETRERHAPLIETLRRWFVLLDGEEHRAARRAVQPLFSPRKIRRLEGVVGEIVERALTEFEEEGGDDAVAGLTDRISARTVAHVLGLPDVDDSTLHRWAGALSDFLASSYRRQFAESASDALREMEEFIGAHGRAESLWAPGGDDRDRLATSSLMLFGGLETTSALISLSLWYMLGHRLQTGVAAPGTEEAAAIVERALEVYAPLGHVARVSLEDTVLGGARVEKGQLVLVSLHGQDVFEPPALSDRPVSHCARHRTDHVALGHGVHYCVGAPLARLTAVTVLKLFARRHPEAVVREVRWRRNRTYRGFEHLRLDLPEPN
ncbi:hypothetical protein [Streptomyces albidoflavus]|uniref:hypothetical protein n=1 Tax=Streptomyces albidoflavus TaxID=1886 RepID=UPI0033E9D7F9